MSSKYKGTFPSVYTTIDYQKRVLAEANRLAYTGRPKEAHYPEGHPTPQCKVEFDKQRGTYKFWSAASRKSASCDVSAAIVVHSVFDKNLPWGLWKQLKYMNQHPEAYHKIPASEARGGDIGHYTKKGIKHKGHIFILGEGDKVKEGSAGNWFISTTNARKARMDMSNKSRLTFYRPVSRQAYTPLKKGSKGEEVKKLQKYLNWYFKDDSELKALKIDGSFGPLTTGRVKLLQRQQKLKVDGVVGKKTLEKMRGVKK